ncbi:MAG TPA: DNA methyltransferase [Candidatus Absconditabacterales bacterium]|nr:DNA methyltransferase [Candidatus Absconditabacterales bacterium]HMT27197.1 DNA methyltransferase [Candidatus Absconditabacterales bacterium]
MKYCAILGKHRLLSKEELYLCKPTNIITQGNIIFFETEQPELLSHLGGIIKYGRICKLEDCIHHPKFGEIAGVSDKNIGMFLKKNHGLKRFKITDSISTDREIKEDGIELIQINQEEISEETEIALIDHYQDIELFETIDFGKPSNGMTVGMMPAKLTQILLNIGIGYRQEIHNQSAGENFTVYDPFCGFGTTGFIANHLNYNFIGSDINITETKKNLGRRTKTKYYKEKAFTLVKHDNNLAFSESVLKKSNLIVSEGWLGPIIHHSTSQRQLEINEEIIFKLYKNFFTNTNNFFDEITGVITIPNYIDFPSTLGKKISYLLESRGREVKLLKQIYQRPKQKVGRQICLFHKDKK